MNVKMLLVTAAVVSALAVGAQDEDADEATESSAEEAPAAESSDGEAAPEGEAADDAGIPKPPKQDTKFFTTLPFCRRCSGVAEVCLPRAQRWEPVQEGKFYPLGSAYRTGADGRLTLAFGKECRVSVRGAGAFGTRPQQLGEKVRAVILGAGELQVSLPPNLPDGMFVVSAPGFTAKDLAGESKFIYSRTGDGDEATVRCQTGKFAVEGRHFQIPKLAAANEFRIRCNQDNLETLIYGVSGDYTIRLDRGLITRTEVNEDGIVQQVSESGVLEWRLSPLTRVQINRAVPSIGERMSVTMMTFASDGSLKNHFAFAEGRAEVNTGELVIENRGEKQKEIAKRAAEVTGDEKKPGGEGAAEAGEDGSSQAETESNSNESEEEEE